MWVSSAVSLLVLRKIATQALYETEEDPQKKDEYLKELEHFKSHGPTVRTFRQFRTFVLQMMLTRAVDNYLAYIAEMLALIFQSRPETLRSSEQVRLDVVLQYTTMEDLVNNLAERQVEKLSYQGMRELAGYCKEKLGLILFRSEQELLLAIEIVEIRNVIVHNRGVVNRRFLDKVKGSRFLLGQVIVMDANDVFQRTEFLGRSVSDIDARACSKFSLVPTVAGDSLFDFKTTAPPKA